MTPPDDTLDSTIRHGLERWSRAGVTDDVDLWPTVARRLRERDHVPERVRQGHRWGSTRRALAASLACVLLAICGITVAAAASPSVRGALHHIWPLFDSGPVSQGYSPQGAPLYMRPVPHFSVFYPATIPSDMVIRGTGHALPGGLQNRSPSPFGLTFVCPRNSGQRPCGSFNLTLQQIFPPAPNGAPYFPAVVSPLVQRGIEAVWFGFHESPPGTTFASIGEWKAARYALPAGGESLTIGGEPSHLRQKAGVTAITMVRAGTAIDLQTNLDRAEAIALAGTLQERNVSASPQRSHP